MTPIDFLMNSRVIAYNADVAKVVGSVKLTILWSQINYWTDKTPDGWVYKSQKDLFNETGLSRKEQETARDIGLELGVLSTMIKGSPPIVHFKVDRVRMGELIKNFIESTGPEVKIKERTVKRESSIEWLNMIPEEDMAEMRNKFSVDNDFIWSRAQDVIDYCESKGKKYANYRAALRNFIKSHRERHGSGEKKQDVRGLIDKALRTNMNSPEWDALYSELKRAKIQARLDNDPAAYIDGKWKVKGASGWVDWSLGIQGHLTLFQA